MYGISSDWTSRTTVCKRPGALPGRSSLTSTHAVARVAIFLERHMESTALDLFLKEKTLYHVLQASVHILTCWGRRGEEVPVMILRGGCVKENVWLCRICLQK